MGESSKFSKLSVEASVYVSARLSVEVGLISFRLCITLGGCASPSDAFENRNSPPCSISKESPFGRGRRGFAGSPELPAGA